jgi:hypothetical protein
VLGPAGTKLKKKEKRDGAYISSRPAIRPSLSLAWNRGRRTTTHGGTERERERKNTVYKLTNRIRAPTS